MAEPGGRFTAENAGRGIGVVAALGGGLVHQVGKIDPRACAGIRDGISHIARRILKPLN